MNKTSFSQNIRIIMAITGKDILDAIRNKTILSTLITMLFIVIAYKILPTFTGTDTPLVFLYDADHSVYTPALENSNLISVRRYETYDNFKQEFRIHTTTANLGLVLPVDFDNAIAVGEEPQIQGYAMNWVNQEKVEEQRIGLENRIAAIVGAPVRINLDGGTLTMLPESFGGFLASAGIVIVIIFMGMTMIPHLILEEKTARTMDALLVSPASTSQIVIAKALAGLFYCLVMVILIIILNYNLILQWGLALLSALLITLFSIVFGLILGSQLESPQQVRLVASLIMVPMFLPVFLSFMVGLVPAWLIAILRWLPPVATSNLIRFSFTDHIDPSQIIPEVGLLLASIFILLIYEVWLLRRADH